MEQDLIDLLIADHRRLESLLAEIETAAGPAERRAALDTAIATLAAHAAAEEQFLHPVLREHLPAGPEIADYEAAEHRRIAELAARLTAPHERDGAFEELLSGPVGLLDTIRQHMQEEETEVFPRLAALCPAGTMLSLGARLQSARVTE